MDIPQLKLLAGRVRELLAEQNVVVGHNQSLDLIAALPGLRNWPEVNAFQERVAACELSATTAARLAHRLRSRHGIEFGPQSLVNALAPSGGRDTDHYAPAVWPSGPPPGVYITTSQAAIDALLNKYDDATDGELVYAEAAGSNWEGAIDLGEYGLSSNGLARVPSGTLIVVGPLQFNQESWLDSANKLEWACLRTQNYGHRVAVLIDTPQPELMFKDAELAVRQVSPPDDDCYIALAGVVSASGDLVPRIPFVEHRPAPVISTSGAPTNALPGPVIERLVARLKQRNVGFLVLGSEVWEHHFGINEIAAALPLTESVGPAARIKSRNRGTPAKDMLVPDVIKALPMLSSVDSAYAHGYRRMLIDPVYADAKDLLKYADEVLFFVGAHSFLADEALVQIVRSGDYDQLEHAYEKLVACIGVAPISVNSQVKLIADMVEPTAKSWPRGVEFDVITEHAKEHRCIRWEDELRALSSVGVFTSDSFEAIRGRRSKATIQMFLDELEKER